MPDPSLVQLKKNPSYNASSMTPVQGNNNFIWCEYLVEVENVSTERNVLKTLIIRKT